VLKRPPPKPRRELPPERSGTKVIIATAALVLAFIGLLWYFSFAALQVRGPDRAFFAQESWGNGTMSLYVNDIVNSGSAPLDTFTARVVAQDGTVLYAGAVGQTVQNGNWSLTVALVDRDGSGTLTTNDDLNITASPEAALDNLLLSTFYLHSGGQEWSHFQIPMV
jgi:hypothetical protein